MATKKTNATSNVVVKKELICKSCGGKPKVIGNFYKSNREEYKQYGGYCPTCKTCLRKSTLDINLNTVTMDSIKEALKKVDKPLVEEVFNVIKEKGVTNEKFLGDYISQLNCYPKYRDTVYSDTIDIQIQKEKLMNAKVDSDVKEEVTNDMILFWGRNDNLSNQDYLDLQTMFNNYTKFETKMDFKKESDYKQMCKYELQKSKIEFDISSIPSVEKLQKMINDISDNLGIQAIQKKEEFGSEKITIGLITRYREDMLKKPIRRFVEDLGGIDPIQNLINIDYLGGLCQSMGIKNPKEQEYKDEMGKFTVKLESLLGEEDD